MLAKFLKENNVKVNVVLAIPAGGVPIGKVISKEFGATFKLALVKKLQIPWQPEAGFGAVSLEGEIVLNQGLVSSIGINSNVIKHAKAKALDELGKRKKLFKEELTKEFWAENVIVVDDGLASGYTMLAAVRSLKKKGMNPKVAIPTASDSALSLVAREAEKVYCLNVRKSFYFAVADAYEKWHDLSYEEVLEILRFS
jgi:predicted phosphoribosyltransferase